MFQWHEVAVAKVAGARRERVYAERARRFPVFVEYGTRTAGLRTIPVLALSRTDS